MPSAWDSLPGARVQRFEGSRQDAGPGHTSPAPPQGLPALCCSSPSPALRGAGLATLTLAGPRPSGSAAFIPPCDALFPPGPQVLWDPVSPWAALPFPPTCLPTLAPHGVPVPAARLSPPPAHPLVPCMYPTGTGVSSLYWRPQVTEGDTTNPRHTCPPHPPLSGPHGMCLEWPQGEAESSEVPRPAVTPAGPPAGPAPVPPGSWLPAGGRRCAGGPDRHRGPVTTPSLPPTPLAAPPRHLPGLSTLGDPKPLT